jgi:hypothetical protein
MKHATKKQNNKRHPLFGRMEGDADLGIAMLIAETEDGHYEPNGPVATINEAIECARHDMASRMRDLERCGEPACPAIYQGLVPRLRRRIHDDPRDRCRYTEARHDQPEAQVKPICPRPQRPADSS